MLAERAITKFIVGTEWPASAPLDSPCVRLHGCADDHLRLIVLLSTELEAQGDANAAQVCRAPRTRWRDRRAAFKHLLSTVPAGTSVRISDFDALFPDFGTGGAALSFGSMAWDDTSLARQKQETADAVVQAAEHVDWWFLRPAPKQAVDDIVLPRKDFESRPPAHTDPRLNRVLGALPPAHRPLVLGLLYTKTLDAWTAARILELAPVDSQPAVVLETAYDALKTSLRETARLLSAPRGAQFLNGRCGPFEWSTTKEPPLTVVDRAEVEQLVRAGWLQESGSARSMHRSVREFLQSRALLRDPNARRSTHRWLGQRFVGADVRSTTEAHFHAIQGLDDERAVETSTYYGADLREMARELSLLGEYERAWHLYRRIVDEFDDEDAYAWEYLAYNLERDGQSQVEVLAAYERAVSLEPRNPLYTGRLLGHRVKLGHDVSERFSSELGRLQMMSDLKGVGFLAKPVFDALIERRRYGQCRELAFQWRPLLTRNEYLQARFGQRAWWPAL